MLDLLRHSSPPRRLFLLRLVLFSVASAADILVLSKYAKGNLTGQRD